MSTDETGEDGIYLPFASATAATAFADLNFVIEKAAARQMVVDGKHDFYVKKMFEGEGNITSTASQSAQESTNNKSAANIGDNKSSGIRESDKVIVNDPTPFENDGMHWGTKSIMNNYSLTSLVGGLTPVPGSGIINYMYDVRDRRRFYGISGADANDVLSVSNPSVTQIIQWANADKWGRTPYTFQDFVYCKYFGLMPNNRLITLRRYHVPTYDNLQWETMFGEIENTTVDASTGKRKHVSFNDPDFANTTNPRTMSPHATVVTWFGGETGNTLSSMMNFTTGIPWEDLQSKIHEVSGDSGSDPQAVIDSMFAGHGAGFGGNPLAENNPISSLITGVNIVTGSILSAGKFALALNGKVGMEDDVLQKQLAAQNDPYSEIYQNRIQGPLNRIDKVKKRTPGIVFSQTLSVKCAYSAKAIGGINPKAALLDCLGNAMEIVSPSAVFWGGGHRFMVTPHTYPYHDGGWRDSFMKKIYDGKIIGNDGAMAMAFSGIKKIGCDESGNFSMSKLTQTLSGAIGDGLALIGAALNSVTSMFGNANNAVSQWLTGKGSEMSGKTPEQQKEEADKRASNLFSNLQHMWHSKVMQQTQLPNIKGNAALLVGEPVGEWHLTVGNPLNPIMVIGNLICTQMQVEWDDELGPDDFPTGFSVTYTLEHGMARDREAIQSMFNRGFGRFYKLPDYMKCSSDHVTYVDKFTKDGGGGDVGNYKSMMSSTAINKKAGYGSGWGRSKVSPGSEPKNHGNAETMLITKFTPVNPYATRTVAQAGIENYINGNNIPVIKSLATTRKRIN